MEIKIPEVGESVREALLAKWFKKNGELVSKDEALCEIETDKITLDIHADAAGILSIQVTEGATVAIGAVIGSIAEQTAEALILDSRQAGSVPTTPRDESFKSAVSSPSLRREMRQQGIAPDSVTGTGKGGRITPDDISARVNDKDGQSPEPDTVPESVQPAPQPVVVSVPLPESTPPVAGSSGAFPAFATQQAASVHTEDAPRYNSGREERKPMSPLRRKIAEHLLAARQQTAMLTTFNEADLSQVKALREKHRDQFQKRHGAPLGLMPFFVKACVEALKEYPSVNASIDGDDLVYHNYYDIGIAIGAEKGLVVPVLRDADKLRMYEIDQSIAALTEKIKTNRLAISDLEGGTFSISNGGVYGSMLSTPILNVPQSGVLGMHAIQDRPVVRDGQIVIRPMMYLALSYDHRIIDGREAVGFLKKIKEYIEDPEELLLEG
ncbi:MAG: 2-oxoglutarate dehydrogenase complex dihydrolipoyllysine-residue succinyltransferase [Desulfuromonadales bacterium]|nr:2-oxoglutarate dehydrogenase complex dihydrolipoyllysine-residue succinyltransferase [Desulfuromonadales bacterium]